MTSFEQPDAGLLVEHLLPSMLRASHSLSQELPERTLFFGELGTTLELLHGRLTVISSPLRETRQASPYPWLWRYVDHFTVGAESNAVQHAKLWTLHWKADDQELLELYVSSTNLTASAFKAQVQAGWRVLLPLGRRPSKSASESWGQLVPFLNALGASAGSVATTRIQRLVTLLGRVNCPADVTFVASIPGHTSAGSQLRKFEPAELHVMTPTIGEWSDNHLGDWIADVGVDASKVHLKWITQEHPWAASNGWTLSTETSRALKECIQLDCLPKDARFTEEHRDSDDRWSHAKLYLIRSRKKKRRRLLITSANWSPSAWGAGRQKPRNFELGVVIETDWKDLETMGERFGKGTAPFCKVTETRKLDDLHLQWGEASWDGEHIHLQTRSSDLSTAIAATIYCVGGSEERLPLVGVAATMPWNDPERTPLAARFTQGNEILEVDIIDLRPPTEFAKTPLPEVDPDIAKALREAFLLQRYGGPAVDLESVAGLGGVHQPASVGATAADYSVQAWVDARAAFNVVDRWRDALAEASSEPVLLDRVRLDGEELRALYARHESPAAGLVVEELRWRLDEEV